MNRNIFNFYRSPDQWSVISNIGGSGTSAPANPNNPGGTGQQPILIMANPTNQSTVGSPANNSPTLNLLPTSVTQGIQTKSTDPAAVSSVMDTVDTLFSMDFMGQDVDLKAVLGLEKGTSGYTNVQGGVSSVIINSDRIIINTKNDHLFLCGKKGVTISSPDSVHIDCTNDIYMFSEAGEIYLGLPNKGQPISEKPATAKRYKWQATPDIEYEPVVLGVKLANLLEDILVTMRQLIVRGNIGDSRVVPEHMTNIEFLISRIPEILSSTAFVDGYSHESPSEKPDLGQIAGFFKTVNGSVDAAKITSELTQVGYSDDQIKAYMASTEGQALTGTGTSTTTSTAAAGVKGAAGKDGEVGANKTGTTNTTATATSTNTAAAGSGGGGGGGGGSSTSATSGGTSGGSTANTTVGNVVSTSANTTAPSTSTDPFDAGNVTDPTVDNTFVTGSSGTPGLNTTNVPSQPAAQTGPPPGSNTSALQTWTQQNLNSYYYAMSQYTLFANRLMTVEVPSNNQGGIAYAIQSMKTNFTPYKTQLLLAASNPGANKGVNKVKINNSVVDIGSSTDANFVSARNRAATWLAANRTNLKKNTDY